MSCRLLLPLLSFALIAAACATEAKPDATASTQAPRSSSQATQPSEPTVTTSPATTVAPATTPPSTQALPEPTPTGTPDAPLAMGTGDEFVYDYWGSVWTGSLTGLTSTGLSVFNEEGTCVLLLGSVTPANALGGIVSESFDAPNFSLLSEGRIVEPGFSDCDVEAAEDLGYGLLYDASVTEGTTFPFYVEFYFPGDLPPLDLMIMGDPTSDDANYYLPGEPVGMPTPTFRTGASPRSSYDVLAVGPATPFIYENWDTVWEGSIEGLVSTPLGFFADGGLCVAVVGSITATSIGSGIVADGFTAPSIYLLVDGHLIDGAFGECDTGPLESEGYGWALDADVTVNTEFLFYQEFYFNLGELPEIDVVVVGDPTTEGAILYEPTIIRP